MRNGITQQHVGIPNIDLPQPLMPKHRLQLGIITHEAHPENGPTLI